MKAFSDSSEETDVQEMQKICEPYFVQSLSDVLPSIWIGPDYDVCVCRNLKNWSKTFFNELILHTLDMYTSFFFRLDHCNEFTRRRRIVLFYSFYIF